MPQILTITWKNLYTTFRDRNLLILMLVTPLMLAIIIGLAFGGGGGGTAASFNDLPVVLVNQDSGVDQNGTRIVYGSTFDTLLLPASPADPAATVLPANTDSACPSNNTAATSGPALNELLTVTTMTDPDAARAAVDAGTYTAAILIPSDYSQRLVSSTPDQAALIQVYGNAGRPISAGVVNSIVESITSSTLKGVAAVQATIGQLTSAAQTNTAFGLYFASLTGLRLWQPDFACAFGGSADPISIQREALTLTQQRSDFVQILITVGTAQAVFFALFTAQGGFGNIFEEKKLGTLPRLFTTPIPRRTILIGYMLGTFMIVVFQLLLLMIALTVVASLFEGLPQLIWGTSPLILVMLAAITISVCGVSLLVVALVSNQQQGNIIASLLNTFFAFLGGTFGIQFSREIAGFSPIYWAVDGLSKLSNQNTDIGLNVLILLIQGVVTFAIGLYFFNKRELV